jgi:predicted RNA-binding Zn-ribbon protein involved in translation (DUF1610 family)
MTRGDRYIRDPASGSLRLKTFTWDCPKCGYRTEVDLGSVEPVDLVCRNCGWSVGQGVDLALPPYRRPSHIDEN